MSKRLVWRIYAVEWSSDGKFTLIGDGIARFGYSTMREAARDAAVLPIPDDVDIMIIQEEEDE